MEKYIVEVPNPKKGQNVSSGGIRENGKLISQFKNPIPYVPTPNPSVRLETISMPKASSRTCQKRIKTKLLDVIWEEVGEPVLRASLRRLTDRVTTAITTSKPSTKQLLSSNDKSILKMEPRLVNTHIKKQSPLPSNKGPIKQQNNL